DRSMRLFYAVFLLTCFGIIVLWVLSSWPSVKPQCAALSFLEAIKQADLFQAETFFGDNTCHCPPKGGYGSLLKYESGHEPNLAFLVGHPFHAGKPTIKMLKDSAAYLLPWDAPESTEVAVPLFFNSNQYRPYFLPLKLAYGQTMTVAEFERALQDLRTDSWKGFSLRLRASLQPGTIKAAVPDEGDGGLHQTEGEVQRANEWRGALGRRAYLRPEEPRDDGDGGLIKELLQAAMFLVPKDAGRVIQASGQQLSLKQIEAQLPRLASITVVLNLQRRGRFRPWRIATFKLLNAVVLNNKGVSIELKTSFSH
ncbi:MAG: hypothetical protein HY711_00590, partial [Candidatus Melainabacteria bacterium]|nr:hypothetical protein [Candidatus Melainabacteria bacterium]